MHDSARSLRQRNHYYLLGVFWIVINHHGERNYCAVVASKYQSPTTQGPMPVLLGHGFWKSVRTCISSFHQPCICPRLEPWPCLPCLPWILRLALVQALSRESESRGSPTTHEAAIFVLEDGYSSLSPVSKDPRIFGRQLNSKKTNWFGNRKPLDE